jgi:hypothetical protein
MLAILNTFAKGNFANMKRFFERLRYWLFKRNKHCKKCCLFCKYYSLCSFDISKALERFTTATINAAKTICEFTNSLQPPQQKAALKEGEQNEVVI